MPEPLEGRITPHAPLLPPHRRLVNPFKMQLARVVHWIASGALVVAVAVAASSSLMPAEAAATTAASPLLLGRFLCVLSASFASGPALRRPLVAPGNNRSGPRGQEGDRDSGGRLASAVLRLPPTPATACALLARRRRRSPLLLTASSSSLPTPTLPRQGWERRPEFSAVTEEEADQDRIVGLYVHLPFCRRRCRYCSFAVVPVGGGLTNGELVGSVGRDALMERYVDAVVREIRQHKDNKTTPPTTRITSVYLGGGTPSLVPVPLLQKVMEAVRDTFVVAPDAEVTVEMDPGTFDTSYLHDAVQQLGCNRISLGIQSLNDTILHHMGRQHTAQDARRALELVQNVASQPQHDSELSYSMDLISSVPGLSLAEWCQTLQFVVDQWNPPHISLYDLQIEKGTVFGTWYGSDETNRAAAAAATTTATTATAGAQTALSLPTEDESAYMYRYASAYLSARGYEHYEVSSYARRRRGSRSGSNDLVSAATSNARGGPSPPPSPYRSRHNQVYWDPDGQWYGFGMGATSHLDGQTVARPKTMHEYLRWVDRGGTDASDEESTKGNEAGDWVAAVAALDSCENIVLKRLRTADGLDLQRDVAQRFGEDHVDAILAGAALGMEIGLAELDPASRVLRLKVPDGFLLSNSVLSSIFVALEDLYKR